MSLDLLILRFVEEVEDLGEADCETMPLGSRDRVKARVQRAFPNAQDAGGDDLLSIEGEAFALEVSFGGEDPILSLHLTLRLGRDWSDKSLDLVMGRLATFCEPGWSIYDVGSNERIHPPMS